MPSLKSKEKLLWFFGIFFYSIVVFCILLAKNVDSFYADDNAMQWGPVARPAFDRLFETGRIPYWDFYQYKGIDIFSSGYYGLTNPFMYISYFISRFIFSYSVDMLTIYEWLLYWLGSWMMFVLLKKLNIHTGTLAVSLIAYSTSVIFFSYTFYYFTFNNYFMIPFIIWIMLCTKDKRTSWFIPGIILAFSLIMGHVQYSCFYVMTYCIIQTVFSVQDGKWSSFFKLFTNIALFAGLSTGSLLLSLKVSVYREAILVVHWEFLSENLLIQDFFNPIPTFIFSNEKIDREKFNNNICLGIFSWVSSIFIIPFLRKISRSVFASFSKLESKIYANAPEKDIRSMKYIITGILIIAAAASFIKGIFGLISNTLQNYIFILTIASIPVIIVTMLFCAVSHKDSIISERSKGIMMSILLVGLAWQNLFFGYMICAFYYAYCSIKKNCQNDTSNVEKTVHALLFAAFFFVIFSLGEAGKLATILYQIPVINGFRYLYKCAFIFIPLFIISGAFILDRSETYKKWLLRASVVLSALSFANIIFITYSGNHTYNNNKKFSYYYHHDIEKEVNEQMKLKNIDKNYRFLTVADPNIYMDKLNEDAVEYSSIICAYALTKNYATPHQVFSLAGYDNIFSDKGFNTTDKIMLNNSFEGMLTNMVTDPSKYMTKLKNSTTYPESFQKQWIASGIRYVLIPSDSINGYECLTAVIDKCDQLHIVRREPWIHNFDIIEVSGAAPICSYGDKEELTMKTEIDSICFDTNFSKATPVTISMTYEPEYCLKLKNSSDGSIVEAELSENEDGFMTAEIPAGHYTAELVYENPKMDLTAIAAAFTTLMTILSVVYISVTSKRETSNALTKN